MPELPEVETTKTSLTQLLQKTISKVSVYQPKLRWQMPKNLEKLVGYEFIKVERRAKYLLLTFSDGKNSEELIIHLGMSGSLQQHLEGTEKRKHDHLIIDFMDSQNDEINPDSNQIKKVITQLHYHDPRRFGAVLWADDDYEYAHRLLNHLGVEPLTDAFSTDYLYNIIHCSQKKPISRAIKAVIMEQKVVVGVGNIYATESLFLSGIHPASPAHLISKTDLATLVMHIKSVLEQAIKQGGSSLRDFTVGNGKTGYFQQVLLAYGHDGKECPNCQSTFKTQKISGRASVFCPKCQFLPT